MTIYPSVLNSMNRTIKMKITHQIFKYLSGSETSNKKDGLDLIDEVQTS